MMRISIVTISYNQARFLPAAVASVSCQLDEQDEHIIVDPGSADKSREIIEAYAANDKRVNTIFEKDQGPADGLNRGFSQAKGEILAYLNSDDFLLPGAVGYVREYFLRHPDVDVLLGAIKMADQHGDLALRGRIPTLPTPQRLVSDANFYCQQGTFFRSSAFAETSGFNITNRTCWDYELIADLAVASAKFAVSSRPLGAFRIHDQSISGTGRLEQAYLKDRKRIQEKMRTRFDISVPPLEVKWLRLSARFNLVRMLQQLRPVPHP